MRKSSFVFTRWVGMFRTAVAHGTCFKQEQFCRICLDVRYSPNTRILALLYFRFNSTNCQSSADILRPPLIIYHNHHLQYAESFPRFIFKHLWKVIVSIASLFLQSFLRSEIPYKRIFSSAFAQCSHQRPGMTQLEFWKTRQWEQFGRKIVRKACRFSVFMSRKTQWCSLRFLVGAMWVSTRIGVRPYWREDH
jgi:hypothetical protein